MSDPKDYTVGWICAIKVELVAAQAFLDENHSSVTQQAEKDNNTYVLGRMGHHNIVIAALPHGNYGLASAATVTRDMVRSFPNLRFILMVGIGGGAPTKRHDVRLGDVVVSSPGNGRGGVLQYDYGKTVQGGAFVLTGHLNQPPDSVLTATAVRQSQHELNGHGLEETIKSILEQKKRLKSLYQKPDAKFDRLYKPSYIHTEHKDDDEDSCEHCGDDASALVSRAERQDSLVIHYGIIASANQLMKDAEVRDRLSEKENILCFEMEAAGMMNNFRCMVIRGICDYADTHKNKIWQGYAAMVAAAYAKDLLINIAPNKIKAEQRLSEVLAKVNERVEDIYAQGRATDTKLDVLRADNHADRIKAWLSPPDPSENLHRALRRRQQGSGQWLIRGDIYNAWKTEKNSFLWLYGIPGCGKTVLSSTIVEDLRRTEPSSLSLLYYYFDFGNIRKQSGENAVRSLISQLYCNKPNTRAYLDSLNKSCNNGHQQASEHALRGTFQSMVQQAGEVWIVLDALDECQKRNEYPSMDLLEWFKFLQGEQGNVHLLVTSRPEYDIKSAIDRYRGSRKHSVLIQSNLVKDDIEAYVHTRVSSDTGLRRWRSNKLMQREIEAALIEKADGMFRWVACQLDELANHLDPPAMRKALASLPKTLDETYARILRNIPEGYMKHTKRMLQFLVYSSRPITIREAVDALAVEMEPRLPFDPTNRMPDPTEIARYCSSLVTIDPMNGFGRLSFTDRKELDHSPLIPFTQFSCFTDSEASSTGATRGEPEPISFLRPPFSFYYDPLQYLRSHYQLPDDQLSDDQLSDGHVWDTYLQLSHFSVKEYLKNGQLPGSLANGLEETTARTSIAQISLAYLIGIKYPDCCSEEEFRTEFPFAYYAAQYWAVQASYVEKSSQETRSLIAEFFRCTSAFHACCELNNRSDSGLTPLHYASATGLYYSAGLLLDEGADVNAETTQGHITALQIASTLGHIDIVKLLLEHGANMRAEGRDSIFNNASKRRDVLFDASKRGRTDIVKLLLDHGADVYVSGEIALRTAANDGHKEIVKLLLEHGASVNGHFGNPAGNALQAASRQGHEDIVKLLLEHGADANVRRGYRCSGTLYAASERGHLGIVRMLLQHGADRHAETGCHGTALNVALIKGHTEIIQVLQDENM